MAGDRSHCLSGYGTLDAASRHKRGAFHFQTKPHNDGLYTLVERASGAPNSSRRKTANSSKRSNA